MNKATLQDISEYTGLSISTVSRILRGESGSNSDNVEKTINAAIKLKYPFNFTYLKNKYQFSSRTRIALITTLFPSEFYATLFAGISQASEETNFDVSYHHINPDKTDVLEYIKVLMANEIEGVILFLPMMSEPEYERLLENLPSDFILISVLPIQNPSVDTITFDSYGGGYLVAQHFYQKGYHNVGIVNGPFERTESLLRRNGYQDYISKHAEMDLVWSYNGSFEFKDGADAFDHYLNSDKKPRAIFFANDMMCVSFLSKSLEHGIKIPEELALVGFDDLPICQYVQPTLTSVRTDYSSLGRKALDVLKSKLYGDEQRGGLQSLIPVTLSKRKSS
ncbi:MAG: LacI family DNA-binding transcriptional regulator [Balneolaceae bacterium]|nr:LacI family DNA-binding transcriptional regulator [Balneolaceae bacterium]